MVIAGPPQKKFKGSNGMATSGGLVAEVRFDDPGAVALALQLDGSMLGSGTIGVVMDQTSKDGSKIIVTNVPPECEWQEVKDHFKSCGVVAFADIKGGGKGGGNMPAVGVVRYSSADEASQAVAMLNGAEYSGSVIEVKLHPGSQDNSKVQVFGCPPGTEWQELKDFFGQAGKVMFADLASGSAGGATGEVRYDDPSHAEMAFATLNGSNLGGSEITITKDKNSQDGTKLVIHGIPPGIEWQELKDHFKQIGTVAFCDVKNKGGGKGMGKGMFGKGMFNPMMLQQMMSMGFGKGFSKGAGKGFGGPKGTGPKQTGEVRYANPMLANLAVNMLNGSVLMGSELMVDWNWDAQDGCTLWVGGIPAGCGWQDLKDHFSSLGPVAFADIGKKGGKGGKKGKF